MNFSNYRFTLDIQKAKTQASIPVHFKDTGNRFYIALTDGGNPYIISDGCRVDIYMRKPNGVPLINACIIENNSLVRYDFNKDTASVEGIHNCELRLYSTDGRLITTPSFVMVVDQRVFYDDEIGTEEDMQTLLALDVIAKEQERRTAEFERWEAEELRALAEESRVEAESGRIIAETERAEAENARAAAEEARALAENERGQELAELKPYVETHIPDHEARISANEGNITNHTNKLADHETRLTGIEGYLAGDNFIVDDSVAYQKDVPQNALEKAKILSVGGMTYRDEVLNTLKNAKVAALKSEGANILPSQYESTGIIKKDGITWTVNHDGTILVNGTNTKDTLNYIHLRGSNSTKLKLEPGTYSITAFPPDYNGGARFRMFPFINGVQQTTMDVLRISTRTWNEEVALQLLVYVPAGETVTNLLVKPMINKGDKALPFAPFVGTVDTFAIPKAAQDIGGIGLGVPGTSSRPALSNHIKFNNGKVSYAKWCDEYIFDGVNVKFAATSTANGSRYFSFACKKRAYFPTTVVSSHFKSDYKMEPGYAFMSGEDNNQYVCFFADQQMTTLAEANALAAKLYNDGNPIKFVVAYATAEETDITNLFTGDNLITVEAGGSIVAENDDNLAAPSSIKYLVTYPKEV